MSITNQPLANFSPTFVGMLKLTQHFLQYISSASES